MNNDTQAIEKAKGTLAKIVLGVIVAPLAIYSTIWLFTTVMATSQSVAIVADGMNKVVYAVQANTKAVKIMGEDNVDGHSHIALMVHEVELAVGKNTVRVDALSRDLHKIEEHSIKHEENLPIWERWKTRVDLKVDNLEEDVDDIEETIDNHKHTHTKGWE